MSRLRADAVAVILLVAAAACILSQGLDWGLGVGVEAVSGDRILRGDVPYRDFWTIYAPGSFYAVAALLGLFGRELSVIHAASAILAGASALAFYALLRQAGLRSLGAALAGLAFLVAIWTPAPSLTTYVVPRLLLLVGWERVLRALREPSRVALVCAGVAFGVAAWFKHDVGAYAALGSGLAVFMLRVRPDGFRDAALQVLTLGGAALGVVLPALAFVAVVGGADAWDDLVAFPLGDFRIVRGEDYPGLVPKLGGWVAAIREPEDVLRLRRAIGSLATWTQAWLPLLALGAAAAVLGGTKLRTRGEVLSGDARAGLPALVLALSCGPFFWMAANVQQNTHVYSLAMLASLGLVGAAPLVDSRRAKVLVAAFGVVLGLGFAIRPAERFVRITGEQGEGEPVAFGIGGASDVRVSRSVYAARRPLVDFIRANVQADEAIYVGLLRHDATVIGEWSLYFLTDRRPATRYHELHPGITESAHVQREMIEDIEAAGVRCVVRWNSGIPDFKYDAIRERRRPELPELGSTELDAYLDTTFASVETFGRYEVYWRRGADRPWESAR